MRRQAGRRRRPPHCGAFFLWAISVIACGSQESPDHRNAPRLDDFLIEHNQVRQEHGVAALEWSSDLANFAQEWADELASRGCALEHRPVQGPFAQQYGENLAWNQGFVSNGAEVTQAWAAEKADYDYDSNSCTAVCGHYTQVVWRTSARLGCAKANCSATEEVWVCNYDPPGNFIGERPY